MELILLTASSIKTIENNKIWRLWIWESWEILERNGFIPLLIVFKGTVMFARKIKKQEEHEFSKSAILYLDDVEVIDRKKWFTC